MVGVYGATYGIYGATKAAVEAMTHVLSKELGPRGINVNVVAPGPVETDMFMEGKSEELLARITRMIPFQNRKPNFPINGWTRTRRRATSPRPSRSIDEP